MSLRALGRLISAIPAFLISIRPSLAILKTSSTSLACRLETPLIVISFVTKLPLLIVNGPLPNPPIIVAVPPGLVACII